MLKTDYLLRILETIHQYFPDIQYITSYARADSITRKSPSELRILREAGLNHIYSGIETGSDQILKLINKGFNADTAVKSGCMAKEADMILSEFILLGIGGKELSEVELLLAAEKEKRYITPFQIPRRQNYYIVLLMRYLKYPVRQINNLIPYPTEV